MKIPTNELCKPTNRSNHTYRFHAFCTWDEAIADAKESWLTEWLFATLNDSVTLDTVASKQTKQASKRWESSGNVLTWPPPTFVRGGGDAYFIWCVYLFCKLSDWLQSRFSMVSWEKSRVVELNWLSVITCPALPTYLPLLATMGQAGRGVCVENGDDWPAGGVSQPLRAREEREKEYKCCWKGCRPLQVSLCECVFAWIPMFGRPTGRVWSWNAKNESQLLWTSVYTWIGSFDKMRWRFVFATKKSSLELLPTISPKQKERDTQIYQHTATQTLSQSTGYIHRHEFKSNSQIAFLQV